MIYLVYENPTPPFVCTICARKVDNKWHRCPRFRNIEPVCSSCERPWQGKIFHGNFMDRRISMQINALAEELNIEAHHAQYS